MAILMMIGGERYGTTRETRFPQQYIHDIHIIYAPELHNKWGYVGVCLVHLIYTTLI